MWSQITNVTDRQTDNMRSQDRALHQSALRGKNSLFFRESNSSCYCLAIQWICSMQFAKVYVMCCADTGMHCAYLLFLQHAVFTVYLPSVTVRPWSSDCFCHNIFLLPVSRQLSGLSATHLLSEICCRACWKLNDYKNAISAPPKFLGDF